MFWLGSPGSWFSSWIHAVPLFVPGHVCWPPPYANPFCDHAHVRSWTPAALSNVKYAHTRGRSKVTDSRPGGSSSVRSSAKVTKFTTGGPSGIRSPSSDSVIKRSEEHTSELQSLRH